MMQPPLQEWSVLAVIPQQEKQKTVETEEKKIVIVVGNLVIQGIDAGNSWKTFAWTWRKD